MEISDQVSVGVSSFKGDVWVHIRRKDKSVSLPSKDFEKLLQRKSEIRKTVEDTKQKKKSHGKKRKHEESSPEYDYYESD